MNEEDKKNRGLPWYCDACGMRLSRFINFTEEETDKALEIMNK